MAVKFSQDNTGKFAQILNKLTFGRFFNEKLVITVDAQDIATDTSNVSGIVSATFKFIDTKYNEYKFDAKKIGNAETGTINFEVKDSGLPEDFKGTAAIVLVDKAGNENSIPITTSNSDMGYISDESDFNFMIERTAPTIDSITPIFEPFGCSLPWCLYFSL